MGKELLPALTSGLVSFLILWGINSFIHRYFNVEGIPEWFGDVLFILLAFIIFIKKDFFFSSPISTGATIGFILAILWNIRGSVFLSRLFKTIFSFRFLLWLAVTAFGIYERSYVVGRWTFHIVSSAYNFRSMLLVLFLVLYILGSTFILFPDLYLSKRRRYSTFSMNRSVPASKKVFLCIIGVIIVFVFSGILPESLEFIHPRLGLSVYRRSV